ncbi:MAG: hypothetical protein A2Y81_03525 [Nitrospirae bacterium RBG_13_43_8]|nr:MAG: hypothetical protein A2Y81_03525 [Nitrospirae bacterium RBG_13_43_8]
MTKAEKIKKELDSLSPESLNEVDNFILSLLLRQRKRSFEERKNIIESLCGSWSDDESIDVIFKEIDLQRHVYPGRKVDFDVPA